MNEHNNKLRVGIKFHNLFHGAGELALLVWLTVVSVGMQLATSFISIRQYLPLLYIRCPLN